MSRLLIIHHTSSPGTQAMFAAVLSGTAADGIEANWPTARTAPAARAEP
ncbi:MAG TPA: hypothetical protein VGI31_07615 [Streptosporangiaceae bacterium]|jgi:hypothetical protein